jgi:predicted nucleotide-binding protein
VSKTEAIEKLEALLEQLASLPLDAKSSEFKHWKRRADRYIEDIFKANDSGQFDEFLRIEFEYIPTAFVSYTDFDRHDDKKNFEEARTEAKILLESFIEEVSEWKEKDLNPIELKIEKIKNLINELNDLQTKNFKRFGANPELDKWKSRAERTIEAICGTESKNIQKFKQISFFYTGPRGYDGVEVPLDKSTFEDAKIKAKALLESLIEEVEEGLHNNMDTSTRRTNTKKIFIVHGHDDRLKEQVETFLLKQGLEPIILHKQASMGRTIIEKLEHYGDVGYTIVLYTYCDDGKAKNDSEIKRRARQNVVFEHGYFIGLLGRERVSFLVDEDVEVPNDLSGAVYVSKSLTWQYDLVKELKAAGYDVTADRVS